MLIVDNTTLIHVDSTSDIIEHYGVKGMRWGQRRMMAMQQRANKYRSIANSRQRALNGNAKDYARAVAKRAIVGQLIAGKHGGALIGALTTTKGSLRRSRDRFNRKAAKLEAKAAKKGSKIAGKDAWKKALNDKRLNKNISDAEKNYDDVSNRKVGLFDRKGRKQKKQDLNDAKNRLNDAENNLYKNADAKKASAMKNYKYKPKR